MLKSRSSRRSSVYSSDDLDTELNSSPKTSRSRRNSVMSRHSNHKTRNPTRLFPPLNKDPLVQSLGKAYVQGIRKNEPYIEHITFEEFRALKFGVKEFP